VLILVGAWDRGSAGGRWQRRQAGEGGGQRVGPGPGALQAQGRAAGVEGQSGGGVQQPVAQRLGFADGELVVEREVLGPGDQVLGDQRELQFDRVAGRSVNVARKRWPSWSLKDSCAPGCGRSRRTITRLPAGQPAGRAAWEAWAPGSPRLR
jgi:hypothetical protein